MDIFFEGSGGYQSNQVYQSSQESADVSEMGAAAYLFFKACGYLAVMMGGGWITDGFVDVGEKGM